MSIARHTSYNLAGSLVPLVVSLVTVPLYIELIGIERYGVLTLFWLVLGFMGFLDLGMGPAVAQRIASLRDGSPDERSQVFWTGLWMNLALGALSAALILVFANLYFGNALRSSSTVSSEIAGSIPWLALTMPVALLSGLAGGALRGRERFLTLNLINMVGSVLMALAPLAWVAVAGPSLEGLIPAALFGRFVALLLLLAACRKAIPLTRVAKPERALVGKLLAFGGWITLSSILTSVLTTVDQFVIGALVGAAGVSVYAIPFNVVSRMTLVPSSLASALFPRFASSSPESARRLQTDSVATLVAIMTPLTVGLVAAIGPFLHLWIGATLGEPASRIAYIIIVGLWANSTAIVGFVYLQAIGRPDLPTKLQLAYLLPYCLLLYLGVSEFGIVGAAIVWSLRSCFDPTLYLFAGTHRRVLPIIAAPTGLILAATAAALLLPWTGWPHWAAMALLVCASLILSLRTLPPAALAQTDWLWRRLPKPIHLAIEAVAGRRAPPHREGPNAHPEL